jgi:uncharacterized membrane protein YbhN (UPF0104 family)
MKKLDPKLRAFIQKWAPLIVSLVIFAGLVVYVLRQSYELEALDLAHIRWELVLAILVIHFATRCLVGLSLKLFAAHFGVHLDAVEWLGLTFGTSATNIFVPVSGGMVAKAAYLKARFNFPITHFASVQAAIYTVIIFTRAVTTCALAALNPALLGRFLWPLVAVMTVMALGSLFVTLVPIRWPFGRERRVWRLVASVLDGWEHLRHSPDLILKQALIVLANQIRQGVELYLALLALGQFATLWQAMMITELAGTMSLVQITPANIGIAELFAGLFANLVDASSISVVSGALLIRTVGVVVTLALGPLFSYILTRRLTNPPDEIPAGQVGQDTPGPEGA